MRKGLLFWLLVVFILTACTKTPNQKTETTLHEQPVPPLTDEEIAERVNEYLLTMTLEQKVGQMIMADRSIDCYSIRRYNIGSIIVASGQGPVNKNHYIWADHYNNAQRCALQSETKIPLLYGVDAVHGHQVVRGATLFPHNIGLGAANDPDLMYRIGEITAKEMARTGLNWNFSPTVAVVQNIQWGRTYESFGEHPELQRSLVKSYIQGLQRYNRVATAKHFIADGGADRRNTTGGQWSIDQGDISIPFTEIERIHLPGFLEAIDAGVLSIMISYNSINGVKNHQNKELITDYLKGALGFEGIVVSDYDAVKQIAASTYYDQLVLAINAGIDVLMEPHTWQDAYHHLVNAVHRGDISMERINDAVKRILTVKFKIGLFENPLVEKTPGELSPEAHRQVAREAVRKSLVLLKNNNKILPLKKNANILLIGPGANDLALQNGGWTVRWQGAEPGDIIEGVSIFEGLKEVVTTHGGAIYTDIKQRDQADVVIVVLAEKPYAEGYGDNGFLDVAYGSEGEGSHTSHPDNLKAIQEAAQTGLPVIVILLSGRPLIVTDFIEGWDALVAAWLPGSEGGSGIADVIFGDYDFVGRLPVTWPKDRWQLDHSVVQPNYHPNNYLFPYGFGLTYE